MSRSAPAWRWTRTGLVVVVCLFSAGTGWTLSPKAEGRPAQETLRAAMEAFWDLEFATAERLAKSIAAMPEASKEHLADAQKVLACVYTMRKAQRDALDSLVRMFQIDRTARFSPDANYPPPVIDAYYTVRDSLFTGTMDVNTIAVGDFENNSVYTGRFKNHDFGALEKALPHLITLDLTEAADLKVVDRQRTAEVLKELQLSASGLADPRQGVQAGKLLGAHAFIFGQYMVLSADKVRIDARIVKTATGEVLTARQITGTFSGKPEVFLELERQLVTELLRTLHEVLGQVEPEDPERTASPYFARKAKALQGRPGYVEGMFLTAEALDAEASRDYGAALTRWKKVLEVDPGNSVAIVRAKILGPLAGQG